ncbi:BREX protein BrxB domain-containing protein [Paratractidigestivibacter sp.]|uniref:BREX protein BrxB domain-containing protein n=1 Tax=Paratractidigestivibacter sp. TaxID=2847316 RepID=UPI002AC89B9B|nr:BREX protein BrxB domain-containing protein [Paratractidigestivibacter sp.]
MFEFTHINDAEPYLVDTLSGDRFLRSAGDLSNSSRFVAPYPPEQQPACALVVGQVARDLAARGVTACVVDAYDELLASLDEQGLWEMYEQAEAGLDPKSLADALKDSAGLSDGRYAARFDGRAAETGADLLIVTGVGAAFPVIRVHWLVENIKAAVPVLVMFPGAHNEMPDGTRSLDILTAPPGHGGGKYRARNIFDF